MEYFQRVWNHFNRNVKKRLRIRYQHWSEFTDILDRLVRSSLFPHHVFSYVVKNITGVHALRVYKNSPTNATRLYLHSHNILRH